MTDFFDEAPLWEWPEARYPALHAHRDSMLIVLGLFLLTAAMIWAWTAAGTLDAVQTVTSNTTLRPIRSAS